MTRPAKLFTFPDPVDEVSARLVALGALSLAMLTIVTGAWWLVLPLAYGFIARVAAGPRFSPLGLLVTRVVRPRLRVAPRLVPGPPKRFAQGMGVGFTISAAVLALGFEQTGAARVVLGLLVVAASLEAFLGICLGCKVFAVLMRLGLIPADVCERCNDLWATRS